MRVSTYTITCIDETRYSSSKDRRDRGIILCNRLVKRLDERSLRDGKRQFILNMEYPYSRFFYTEHSFSFLLGPVGSMIDNKHLWPMKLQISTFAINTPGS